MAQRQQGRKIYRTMQGKQIDMDLLRKKNELTPAVGNARVNARGDELGPGGKIIKKREDLVKEYYNKSSQPVVDEPSRASTQTSTVAEEKATVQRKKTTRAQEKVEKAVEPTPAELAEFDDMDDGWVEDDDGNFIQKGE